MQEKQSGSDGGGGGLLDHSPGCLRDFSGRALKRREAEAHVVEHSGGDVDKGHLIRYSKLALIRFSSA